MLNGVEVVSIGGTEESGSSNSILLPLNPNDEVWLQLMQGQLIESKDRSRTGLTSFSGYRVGGITPADISPTAVDDKAKEMTADAEKVKVIDNNVDRDEDEEGPYEISQKIDDDLLFRPIRPSQPERDPFEKRFGHSPNRYYQTTTKKTNQFTTRRPHNSYYEPYGPSNRPRDDLAPSWNNKRKEQVRFPSYQDDRYNDGDRYYNRGGQPASDRFGLRTQPTHRDRFEHRSGQAEDRYDRYDNREAHRRPAEDWDKGIVDFTEEENRANWYYPVKKEANRRRPIQDDRFRNRVGSYEVGRQPFTSLKESSSYYRSGSVDDKSDAWTRISKDLTVEE